MNREIKFRGKRLKIEDPLQRWIEGTLAVWTDIYGDERICIVSKSGYHNHVDPNTVGQYTGLKDRNGTEIYEGDIMKSQDFRTSHVMFHNGRFIAAFKGDRSEVQVPLSYLNSFVEIIGNIHDNPELMKGGKYGCH